MAGISTVDLHLLENSGGQGREMVQLEQDMEAFDDMEIAGILDNILGVLRDISVQVGATGRQVPRPRRGCTRFGEMTHQLPDGTWVRHRMANGHQAIGIYNEQRGVLEWEGQAFEYPSGFTKAHSGRSINGWGQNVCHALLEGQWVSLHTLR